MKVNGNQKNGNPTNSQGLSSDNLSKKAVSVVEDMPLKNFDAQKTWEKLSHRLGQMDKRFVTWGLAMAASFSLLVAANIEMLQWENFDKEIESEVVTERLQPKNKKTQVISKEPTEIVITEKIAPVQKKSNGIKEPVITPEVANRSKTILLLDKTEQADFEISPLSNPFVSIFAKANFQFEGVAPEIGMDFKIAENYTAKRREIYKIGVSSQFNYKQNEEGNKRIHPHTFVNLEFTSLNKKTNKGWTTRAGYLLNPDGQLYQDTTIKVSLFRNISKHIKVGPEVIFTNNMKTSYPSISLILG